MMRCAVCGAELKASMTDLPFKVDHTTTVIVSGLPVVQCGRCPEYLVENEVLERVDEIVAKVEGGNELEPDVAEVFPDAASVNEA